MTFSGSSKTKHSNKRMVEAMIKEMGIVSKAEKVAGITRATHYAWRKSDPAYDEAIKEVEETNIDIAESKLLEGIMQGDKILIMFYLKTKGKKRNYVERQEVAGVEEQPVEINVVIGKGKDG